jgi:acetyl-CoA synthetase
MPWESIHKTRLAQATEPNLKPNLWDYEEVRSRFTWDQARSELDGLPGGGLNIAHEAIDRHLAHGRGEQLALRWLGKDGAVRDFRYRDLAGLTNRNFSRSTMLSAISPRSCRLRPGEWMFM